jgi:hypothetical protein
MTEFTHARALSRMFEITERIDPEWLTSDEILSIVAVLEPADQRVNAPAAPVLRLAPKQRRRRSTQTGTRSA